VEKGELGRLKSYAQRGRAFGTLSDSALAQQLVGTYRLWAKDVSDPNAILLTSDLHAEFKLRKLSIPFDLVMEQIDTIRESAAGLRARADLSESPPLDGFGAPR
jgi:hypothetical protein